MKLQPFLNKIFNTPVFSVKGTWIDAAIFVMIFLLLSLAVFFLRRGRIRQKARIAIRMVSLLVIVFFFFSRICLLKISVMGIFQIGWDDISAFSNLYIFILVASFVLLTGNIYCGWLCPLGFLQDISRRIFSLNNGVRTLLFKLVSLRAKRSNPEGCEDEIRSNLNKRLLRHFVPRNDTPLVSQKHFADDNNYHNLDTNGIRTKKMKLIFWLCILIIAAALLYITKPATDFFTENIIAIWALGLLAVVLAALISPKTEPYLKNVRYVSFALYILVSSAAVWFGDAWCWLAEGELDYSSLIGFVVIFLTSAIIPFAWCRYLCPTGTCLSMLGRRSFLKIKSSCKNCGKPCQEVCPNGAKNKDNIDYSLCVYCGKCFDYCGSQY